MLNNSFAATVISQSRRELVGHTPEVIFQILHDRFRTLHVQISDDEIQRIADDIARLDVPSRTPST